MIGLVPDELRTDGRVSGRRRVPLISTLPPLPPDVWARRPVDELPWPLELPEARIYAFGRQALFHGLAARGVEPGDEVLMPAWHHGSEVEAVIQAGMAPRFYDIGSDAAPDRDALDGLIGPRTRAFYLIHPLGLPHDAAAWRRWSDERGLLLIEDAAQAWRAHTPDGPAGSFGQLAIFCLYKTYGLPEGAALLSDPPPEPPSQPATFGLSELVRRHASWAAARSAVFASAARPLRRPVGSIDAEHALRGGDSPPWSYTDFLLRRLAGDDAAAARRANYATLLRELGDRVADGFGELPAGASPFMFPLRAGDKAAVVERSSARGVRAIEVWSSAHPVLAGAFPGAAERRATTVGLPVHQELRAEDLDRILCAVAQPPRGAPAVLEPVERLEDLDADFDRLAETSRNLFATWDWVSLWWRHFGAGRELRTFAVRDAARDLVGIVPAYLARERPLSMLRFIGHGAGDRLGPVCAPEHAPLVARALDRAFRDGRLGGDVLLAEQLPAEERWPALLGATVLNREGSPVLHVEGSFDDWLASRSRNFREQVRRRERKLAREHQLDYRLTAGEQELEADLETLFRLHDERWGDVSDSFTPERRAFHLDFARTALKRGRLRLWTMSLDGRPVASWLGYRYAGAEWYYQAGRDPDWEKQAVGFVLMAHTIREAVNDGVNEYRLLRGGEEYKARFASSDPGLETAVAGRGAAGRLGLAGAIAAAALPEDTRRRVRSLTG
jgi:CelD/BcsL family acetyltransferase involved in cellulose biosynthesis